MVASTELNTFVQKHAESFISESYLCGREDIKEVLKDDQLVMIVRLLSLDSLLIKNGYEGKAYDNFKSMLVTLNKKGAISIKEIKKVLKKLKRELESRQESDRQSMFSEIISEINFILQLRKQVSQKQIFQNRKTETSASLEAWRQRAAIDFFKNIYVAQIENLPPHAIAQQVTVFYENHALRLKIRMLFHRIYTNLLQTGEITLGRDNRLDPEKSDTNLILLEKLARESDEALLQHVLNGSGEDANEKLIKKINKLLTKLEKKFPDAIPKQDTLQLRTKLSKNNVVLFQQEESAGV